MNCFEEIYDLGSGKIPGFMHRTNPRIFDLSWQPMNSQDRLHLFLSMGRISSSLPLSAVLRECRRSTNLLSSAQCERGCLLSLPAKSLLALTGSPAAKAHHTKVWQMILPASNHSSNGSCLSPGPLPKSQETRNKPMAQRSGFKGVHHGSREAIISIR